MVKKENLLTIDDVHCGIRGLKNLRLLKDLKFRDVFFHTAKHRKDEVISLLVKNHPTITHDDLNKLTIVSSELIDRIGGKEKGFLEFNVFFGVKERKIDFIDFSFLNHKLIDDNNIYLKNIKSSISFYLFDMDLRSECRRAEEYLDEWEDAVLMIKVRLEEFTSQDGILNNQFLSLRVHLTIQDIDITLKDIDFSSLKLGKCLEDERKKRKVPKIYEILKCFDRRGELLAGSYINVLDERLNSVKRDIHANLAPLWYSINECEWILSLFEFCD